MVDDARERRQRVRARAVAYGTVAALLLAAYAHTELWPLTSFRLFSQVRDSTTTSSELVAVRPDGARTVVRADPRNPLLVTTAHQYRDLVAAPPARQEAMVDAWLGAAGLDPADVTEVRLERVTREQDPRTLEWRELSRDVVVEVSP